MKKIFIFGIFFLALIGVLAPREPVLAACAINTLPMHIVVRDADGKLTPNINFAVYSETKNPDGKVYFDERVRLATGKTDAGGQSDVLCLSATSFPYTVKFYESSATYGYFSIESGGRYTYDVELKMSDLFVIIRDAEGMLIKNSSFDIFVQGFDVDGNPIIDETKLNQDKLVAAKVNTGDVGGKHMYLAPGSYVVRMHATGGKEYFYLWNQKVVAEKTTVLDYRQGTLRTILEDGNGSLVKEQKFSIYTQAYDAQNKPIVGTLIADKMQTGSAGKVDAYLPNGSYALKIPSASPSLFYYIWKVPVSDGKLTTSKYRLSGMRVILRDDNGEIARNAAFSVASQKIDALGKPVVDVTVASRLNTGEAGFKDVYLPAGTYVLTYNKKNLYQIDVADTFFTKVDWSKTLTARLHPHANLFTPLSNVNLTMRKQADPTVRLKNFSKIVSSAFKVDATKIDAPYTVTFFYSDDQLLKKGVKANKLAIALYNASTKKWQYVGRNVPDKKVAVVHLKVKGILVLVAQK